MNYCEGCRDDFYNGNNNLGIKKCWHRKNHKVEWLWKVHKWTYGIQERIRGLYCWSSKDYIVCKEKYYK